MAGLRIDLDAYRLLALARAPDTLLRKTKTMVIARDPRLDTVLRHGRTVASRRAAELTPDTLVALITGAKTDKEIFE